MENIVDMPPSVITRLTEAASHADATGARMRILTGVNGDGRKWVKWDCGRGWTEPYFSQDTPPLPDGTCRRCHYLLHGKWDGAAGVLHTCGL